MKKSSKVLLIVSGLLMSAFFVACAAEVGKETNHFNNTNDAILLEKVFNSDNGDELYTSSVNYANAFKTGDIKFQTEYEFGVELSIPQRTISIDGKELSLDSQVIFPDGKASMSNKVTLTQSGIYEVRYATVYNETPYLVVESFQVKNRTYYTGDASSSFYYGSNEYSPIGGLNVNLAKGDTLQFEQIIDISELSKDVPLIEVYATPRVAGNWDFSQLYLTFTDVENTDISLTVKLQRSKVVPYFYRTYIQAGGNDQPLTGWELTDTHNKLHVDNQYGTLSRHSFTGASTLEGWSVEEYPARIFFDKNDLVVYSEKDVIADLDSEDFFNKLWNGFSGDKVRLSIQADEYTDNGTANFCISSIYGLDLSNAMFADVEAPMIKVERKVLPTAKAGGVYEVATATGFDYIDGKTEVFVSAWYNYGSNEAVRLNIVDGKFSTTLPGMYAIVYESRDKAGNCGRYIENVVTGNVTPLTFDAEGKEQSGELGVGQKYVAPIYPVNGGSGDCTVMIIAEYNEKSYPIEDFFYPEEVGEWKILYTATDMVGQTATFVYTLNVVESDTVVFAEEPILPISYISGSKYVIPTVRVFDYSSGKKQEKTASVTVEDANGKNTYQAGDIFTPTVNEHKSPVKLTFEYGNVSTVKEVPVAVVWVQAGRPKLYMQNYFLGSGFALEKNTGDITVQAQETNASWVFANQLLAENFSAQFEADVTSNEYAGLRVTLRDVENEDECLTFDILKYERRSNLKIGEKTYALPMGFIENSVSNRFDIQYFNRSLRVGETVINIQDINESFKGFSSNKLYLEVGFIEAGIGAQYKILHINDTVMCNLESDKSGPKITVYGELGGCYRLNDSLKIPKAEASDVFDPNVTLTMTVLDPNGQVAKDKKGTLLNSVTPDCEYDISLNLYGAYTITYTAFDTFNRINNEAKLSYSVHVEDCDAPSIVFNGDFPTTAKIGDIIKMPTYKVSDNCTSEENLIVSKYIVQPNGHMISLSGSKNAIKCEVAGIYEFRIYVTDEKGNSTLIRKYVTVS